MPKSAPTTAFPRLGSECGHERPPSSAGQTAAAGIALANLTVALRLGAMTVLALAAGCVRHYPTDLDISVRDVVDRSGIVAIARSAHYPRLVPPWERAILLRISSRENFVRRAASAGATISLDGHFCEGMVANLVYHHLYVNGAPAKLPLEEGGARNLPQADDDGLYVLDGFLKIRDEWARRELDHRDRIDPSQEYYETFDLEKRARDVCLYVIRGTMWLPFSVYKSNVVVIPKEEIATVLMKAKGE